MRLKAINPCYMDGDEDEPALTVGKIYEIFANHGSEFCILDDTGCEHWYDWHDFNEFFEKIENTSNIEQYDIKVPD